MESLKNFLLLKNIYTEERFHKLVMFLEYLLKKNEDYNLTAITDKEEAVWKHLIDSLHGTEYYKGTVLDIGAGAGLPSIPVAIVRQELNITLCDSVGKKISFLEEIKKLLDIKNIQTCQCRAEDLSKTTQFHTVVMRGVAALKTIAEYGLPFLKIGGRMIAYKGQKADEEIEDAKNALRILGGKPEKTVVYHLDINGEIHTRNLVFIQKIKETPPQYPRGQNKPRLKPL